MLSLFDVAYLVFLYQRNIVSSSDTLGSFFIFCLCDRQKDRKGEEVQQAKTDTRESTGRKEEPGVERDKKDQEKAERRSGSKEQGSARTQESGLRAE